MRMIYNVIDQMVAAIPEAEKPGAGDLIRSLERISKMALYKAPEQMPQYFEMTSSVLQSYLGDPTGVPWKEQIRDIFADRVKPVAKPEVQQP